MPLLVNAVQTMQGRPAKKDCSLKEEENCNKFIFRVGVVLSSGAVIRLYGLVLSLALLALV
jgi:hypothetical protein